MFVIKPIILLGKGVNALKKLLLLLIIVPCLCAFDYQRFPDLTNKYPVITVYDLEKNIFWQIFDIDENGVGDVAIGFEPNDATPVFLLTPIGMELVWEVDIEGVSASYYWMDLDGDGLPFKGNTYNYKEILYDPKGDGLNGNEENQFTEAENTEKLMI